jgi:hypothetical protein
VKVVLQVEKQKGDSGVEPTLSSLFLAALATGIGLLTEQPWIIPSASLPPSSMIFLASFALLSEYTKDFSPSVSIKQVYKDKAS